MDQTCHAFDIWNGIVFLFDVQTNNPQKMRTRQIWMAHVVDVESDFRFCFGGSANWILRVWMGIGNQWASHSQTVSFRVHPKRWVTVPRMCACSAQVVPIVCVLFGSPCCAPSGAPQCVPSGAPYCAPRGAPRSVHQVVPRSRFRLTHPALVSARFGARFGARSVTFWGAMM